MSGAVSAPARTRPGWTYLGEEPYFFDHWGYGEGASFRQVMYDYGAWQHPRGEEATMDNIGEFTSDYPPGWYWSGAKGSDEIAGGGPFVSREAAQVAAELGA
jgi:hypothetical protein